tara:strand:- start:5190 stop:5648 length:459 start_codon:yes stop_codon:yes gene_type:complete
MSKIPNLTWAQNKNTVYVNIILEPKDHTISIDEDQILNFKQDEYELKLKLFDKVNKDSLKIKTNRHIELDISKETNILWKSLTPDLLYKNNISFDWSRWVDEDEDEDLFTSTTGNDLNTDNLDANNLDPSMFNDLSEEDLKELIIQSNKLRK